MDYQEAIEIFKIEIEKLNTRPIHVNHIEDAEKAEEAMRTAISAMQELEQYRQLGASPQRCAELISERSAAKRILAHYETISTLEECREAVKWQQAKEPKIMNGMYGIVYLCNECGNELELGSQYCPFCGQKLDWG